MLDGRHIPHYEADYDFSFGARRAGAAVMVNMPSLEEVREWYGAWKIKHGSAVHLNLDDGKNGGVMWCDRAHFQCHQPVIEGADRDIAIVRNSPKSL